MKSSALRKTAAVTLLGVATMVAPIVAVPGVAHAAAACRDNNMPADPPDKGGKNAEAWWSRFSCDSWNFKVSFQAYDEIVWVRSADAVGAKVEVAVWNKAGTEVVDRDTLTGKTKYQIGYPDGSGNISDGRRIDIRLCVGAPYYACTAWASGVS